MRLQDRGGNSHAALLAARNQLLGLAGKSPLLPACALTPGRRPQLQLDIDRDKAQAMGVSFGHQQRAVHRARLQPT